MTSAKVPALKNDGKYEALFAIPSQQKVAIFANRAGTDIRKRFNTRDEAALYVAMHKDGPHTKHYLELAIFKGTRDEILKLPGFCTYNDLAQTPDTFRADIENEWQVMKRVKTTGELIPISEDGVFLADKALAHTAAQFIVEHCPNMTQTFDKKGNYVNTDIVVANYDQDVVEVAKGEPID